MNIQSRMAEADGRDGGDAAMLAGDPPAGRRRAIVAGILLLIVAVVLWATVFRHPAAKPVVAPVLPRVTVTVPGRSAVSATVSATGTLAARREMPVGVAGEGGRVVAVLVEQGQWVAAGQTLATIDRSVQQQQAAQLASAIDVARADAVLAQSDLDRSRNLVARGFISKADIEKKTATRDAANARVAMARAQLNETRALIGRLDVRAPAAGLVLSRAVEPGQIVSAGSAPLFRIARDGELEALTRLAETDLARMTVGRPAKVTPVGSQRSFIGRIWQLSPTIDATTRQGIARVALPYDPALRPGGFASIEIGGGAAELPLLPESAVLSDDKGNYVYVVGADNVVARRAVTIGDVSDRGISIASGLAGTEPVVVSAGAFLHVGDKVVPERRAATVDR